MWAYHAPLREMQFVIEQVLDAPAQWAATPAPLDDFERVVRVNPIGTYRTATGLRQSTLTGLRDAVSVL
jgi:hypothetical protein